MRTGGTAFVGAGLVIKGLSLYLTEHAIQTSNDTKDPIVLGLLTGLILLCVTGTLVQLHLFRDEDKSDDDFMAQEDEGSTCL